MGVTLYFLHDLLYIVLGVIYFRMLYFDSKILMNYLSPTMDKSPPTKNKMKKSWTLHIGHS